ncbi:MAG: DUF3048 domain-containing protein [Candidatus Planktophila sp.]
MSFKKLSLTFILAVAAGFFYFNYSGNGITLPFAGKVEVSSLTGRPGKDGPILVVKIDDTTLAHPQTGLKDADVVYIEQVEGGLTRLAAVFSSNIPTVVGPVRSARISDIELLAQYGKVGFSYSGAQRKFLPVLAAANLYNFGATSYGPSFYANDPVRTAPYAMMLKAKDLLAEAATRGAVAETARNMGWNFGDLSADATPLDSVHISWPASSYDAKWSAEQDRWLLTHNGNIDTDESGYQLGPKNIIIQIVSITDSIYKDKVGGITPLVATVGVGKCYILRDATVTVGEWMRPDEASGTTFTDSTGAEILLTPGQIWIALTSKEAVLTPLSP